jgi:hypothetical protein
MRDEEGEAYARWCEIFLWQHHQGWDETARAINGRAAENTVRLATIRAISRDSAKPLVMVDDIEWAWAIVYQSIVMIAAGVERHMSASPAEALRKSILEAVRSAPDGLPFSKLLTKRGVGGAQLFEVESSLQWLLGSSEIVDMNRKPKPGPGSKFRLNELE